MKTTILTFADYYLPGYKAGGPIRTIANMVEELGDEFQFNIITRDRDSNDKDPYHNITAETWNKTGKANVYYISPQKISIKNLLHLIKGTNHDIVYLNSFFSNFTIKVLLLKQLGFAPDVPVVIAPRGEFSSGALNLKAFKKKPYILLTRMIKLYKSVIWQASSEYEEADIQKQFGNKIKILIAPNVPSVHNTELNFLKKESGFLRIIFLSGIVPKKNILYAINLLGDLKGIIEFNIYGPIKDKGYWEKCQKTILTTSNDNLSINYKGPIPNDEVISAFSNHHLLLLPTLGENFGHVILESLTAGCPVLISDRTPWRDLEAKGVGWDVSLDNEKRFKEILQEFIDMDQEEFNKFSRKARDFSMDFSNNKEIIDSNKRLFINALKCEK